ncbi:hypothetical protein N4R57_20690 [Rhodobacteraceae bacterium D3-12]|nr:hypothetical protein N4R57_20690 [Rhodobacteraceae bacterium D3-12]
MTQPLSLLASVAGAILAAGLTTAPSTVSASSQSPFFDAPIVAPDRYVPDIVVRVQSEEGSGEYGGEGPTTGTPSPPTASSPMNSPIAVTRALRSATQFCGKLTGGAYAVDCLAYEYWEIQRQLPDVGEMAEVKKVLADTSKKLRALANANQSKTAKPIRVSKSGKRFNRVLVPVQRQKLPRISRDAARIINNGATLLIRASGDSNRKRAQYQQIAKSMQTGAILLRSL